MKNGIIKHKMKNQFLSFAIGILIISFFFHFFVKKRLFEDYQGDFKKNNFLDFLSFFQLFFVNFDFIKISNLKKKIK